MISENHSGIVWSLLALIILTLSGVFLSMLVDKRISFSHSRNNHAQQIADQEIVLHSLRGELAAKTERLSNFHSAEERAADEIKGRGNQLRTLEESIASLKGKKEKLPPAIRELEEAFADYRREYREAEWRHAVGERIDSLFLKNGRHFERVIIHRVTPLGLEISHSRGSARIDSGDLGSDYKDRFQWEEGEREAFLAKGRERSAPPENTSPVQPIAATPPGEREAERDEAAIAALRKEISLWRTKGSSLRSEYYVAAGQESRRSVPGSLRTWGEQAATLRVNLTRAEAGLALAVGKLRALSPNDPVLAVPR